MLSCLLLACVGIAGDGWSYSKCEARPGVSKAAARTGPAGVPTAFAGRSVAKLVEHTPAVPPSPAPQPKPEATVQPAVEPVKDAVLPVAKCGPFGPKPEPPNVLAKDCCKRCRGYCGCQDACFCDRNEATKPTPQKMWYVMPEDSMMEAYGYVDANDVLRYDSIRPRQTRIQTETRAVIRYDTPLPTTNYYPVYTQVPTMTSGDCVGGSCGRPTRGRG